MAVATCCCGGIKFVSDTPMTRAREFGAEGREAEWLVLFMWMNYDMAHVEAA